MALPKSPEGKAAKKITDAMNVRGMSNRMIAYHITNFATKEVQNELFDVFLHLIRAISESPIPTYFTMDDAAQRVLADSIVRAVEESGREWS